jgi:uncharacterized protein YpuA (DUF1002 family)
MKMIKGRCLFMKIKKYLKETLKTVNKDIEDLLNDFNKNMSHNDKILTMEQIEILVRYRTELKGELNAL